MGRRARGGKLAHSSLISGGVAESRSMDGPYIVVCTRSDLAATGARGFAFGNGDWPLRGFVVQSTTGAIRAWVNRCPHAGHRLELREHDFLTVDRQLIQCRSHGALFDPLDGRCVAGPCAGRKLSEIRVQIHGEEIRIVRPDAGGLTVSHA